jgi:cell division protein FtsA
MSSEWWTPPKPFPFPPTGKFCTSSQNFYRRRPNRDQRSRRHVGHPLEVDCQIIQASVPFIKNLTKCILQAGLEIDDLVLAPLAAAQAVLTKKQKELGVAVIDLGGGTTGLVVFEEGDLVTAIFCLSVPCMSPTILAIGLRTSVDTAEKVKLAVCSKPKLAKSKKISTLIFPKSTSKKKASLGHQTRGRNCRSPLEEIFDLVNKELKYIGKDGQLPAGAILTGGGAKLPGIVELGQKAIAIAGDDWACRDP